MRLRSVSEDESEESTAYIIAKDENGNILPMRSVPSANDEISEGKYIQRVNKYVVQGGELSDYISPTGWNIEVVRLNIDNLSLNPTGGANLTGKVIFENANIYEVSYNDRTTVNPTGLIWYSPLSSNYIYIGAPQGTWGSLAAAQTALAGVTLNYQLAEPIITPVDVSGTLLSYPSGTVYVENAVADAGIYGEEGITVLHEDLPIKELETLSKIDFVTGLETKLDISKAVINQDKLSFTHPDLEAGDIVFFTYFYDREGTQGEFTGEYYDSRYVVKDSVTDKFYKWSITVSNGTPSISLMEV